MNFLFNFIWLHLTGITQKFLQCLTWRSAVCILLITLSSCSSDCHINNPVALISGDNYQLQVELAVHDESQRCGLSLRDQLANDHGMLFVFDHNQILSFWMKDTRIPLSIAFLNVEGEILNIRTMQPMNDQLHYYSASLARYALEVNQGWFADHGIKPGDKIPLPVLDKHLPSYQLAPEQKVYEINF